MASPFHPDPSPTCLHLHQAALHCACLAPKRDHQLQLAAAQLRALVSPGGLPLLCKLAAEVAAAAHAAAVPAALRAAAFPPAAAVTLVHCAGRKGQAAGMCALHNPTIAL